MQRRNRGDYTIAGRELVAEGADAQHWIAETPSSTNNRVDLTELGRAYHFAPVAPARQPRSCRNLWQG